jgi:hypothetical protein
MAMRRALPRMRVILREKIKPSIGATTQEANAPYSPVRRSRLHIPSRRSEFRPSLPDLVCGYALRLIIFNFGIRKIKASRA